MSIGRGEYYCAVAVAVVLVMIGAAITAAPSLGLTDAQVAMLGIASAGLGVLASVLPKIQQPPTEESH